MAVPAFRHFANKRDGIYGDSSRWIGIFPPAKSKGNWTAATERDLYNPVRIRCVTYGCSPINVGHPREIFAVSFITTSEDMGAVMVQIALRRADRP